MSKTQSILNKKERLVFFIPYQDKYIRVSKNEMIDFLKEAGFKESPELYCMLHERHAKKNERGPICHNMDSLMRMFHKSRQEVLDEIAKGVKDHNMDIF